MSEIKINGGTINNSQIGDYNTQIINGSNDEWKQLENNFAELLTKVEKYTGEYVLIKEAKELSKEKEKSGLGQFIQNNLSKFTEIFSKFAVKGIIGLIKKLTGIEI